MIRTCSCSVRKPAVEDHVRVTGTIHLSLQGHATWVEIGDAIERNREPDGKIDAVHVSFSRQRHSTQTTQITVEWSR